MSGVNVVNDLLSADVDLTAVVPAERIASGPIKQGTALPAISIGLVSGVPFNTVSMAEPTRLYSDRVQVTVHAKEYDDRDAIQALVRLALPMTRGALNGVDLDSIRPDIVGPDQYNPATSVHERGQDFIVKWRALNTAPVELEDGGFILLE